MTASPSAGTGPGLDADAVAVAVRGLGEQPLFPRFVRSALEPGNQILLDVLSGETIDEVTAKNLIRRAKALWDAMDAGREGRKKRLRRVGLRNRRGVAEGVLLRMWGC